MKCKARRGGSPAKPRPAVHVLHVFNVAVATKLHARFADLLDIVVPATTFVVRLVIIAIWSVTRFVEELISASLANHENLFHQVTIVITWE